ncbi:MAG TPA: metalloregulator ArsR/SmtB family transcription factor [Candidatus Elarobacter sp.]|nr:metalloregulator ArsR/SmtB family transcription factor [Candidatus Elarobacter sp.]
MAPTDDEVVLSDPRALRALAHPARLTVVEDLYQGTERTASELAELTGLTPSAMSYHLRALERWGIVERAEIREDARERPWRAAGRGLTVSGSEPGALAATEMIVTQALVHLGDALRRWAAAEKSESADWQGVATMRHSYLWLDAHEAAAFKADLNAVFEKHLAGRNAARHPAGARRVLSVLALVPEVDDK